MENEPKKEIQWDLRELYKTRVIVLLESEPLSNKYRQIVFTHVQFQLFVAFMNSLFPNPGSCRAFPSLLQQWRSEKSCAPCVFVTTKCPAIW